MNHARMDIVVRDCSAGRTVCVSYQIVVGLSFFFFLILYLLYQYYYLLLLTIIIFFF